MSLRELNSLIFLDMKICRRVFVKFPVYQDDSASNFFILPDLLHLDLEVAFIRKLRTIKRESPRANIFVLTTGKTYSWHLRLTRGKQPPQLQIGFGN